MNRVLLEVAKGIDSGKIDDTTCALTLAFIVEKTPLPAESKDDGLKLAHAIRRALVDLDTPEDYDTVVSIIGSAS